MSEKKPNIVYMICHDMGVNIGAYGVHAVHTPNLDNLSEEGVRFENSFCTSPACSPSRASLMTGRYPHSNGVMGLTHGKFCFRFNKDEQPMTNILADNGYDTFKFGLQHATSDESFLNFRSSFNERDCRDVAINFENFLKERKQEGNSRPFFTHIGFIEPHRPFELGDTSPDDSNGVFVPPYLNNTEAVRKEFAKYQGAIRKVDKSIGDIIQSLDRYGFSEDTLIVFTVDHGEPFPRAKCSLYDPGIRVALIMRYKAGNIVGGRVYEELISNIDVLPTILDIAGLQIPQRVQGKSFWPLLKDTEYKSRTEIFAEKTYHNYYDPVRAVRTQRYKLIYNFENTLKIHVPDTAYIGDTAKEMDDEVYSVFKDYMELYDLQQDPLEQKNLAEEMDYRDVKVELLKKLFNWMRETEDPIIKGPIPSAAYMDRVKTLYDYVNG